MLLWCPTSAFDISVGGWEDRWIWAFQVYLCDFCPGLLKALSLGFEGSDLLIIEPVSFQNLRSWIGGFPDAARFGGMSLWTIIEVAKILRSGNRWSRRVKSKGGM